MRRFLTWLAAALLLPILATAALLIFAIEAQPLVERSDAISPLSIAQARRLLATHDPRRQRSGDIATVPIPAGLIDEARSRTGAVPEGRQRRRIGPGWARLMSCPSRAGASAEADRG